MLQAPDRLMLQGLLLSVALGAAAGAPSSPTSTGPESPAAEHEAGPEGAKSDGRGQPIAAASRLVPGGLLDIQVVLGFANTFRLARWTPVTVTVSNRGNDLVGHLEVQASDTDAFHGNLFTASHRRDLELPRDSRKRFRFTVFLESLARPLVIRVISDGRELARREIDLRHRFTTGRLILVLSRDADLDYLNDSTGESLRVLYPHPELLPDRWQGYDGIEAIVIHGVSLEHLSARQYEAVRKWVAEGGILAVSGGPDYSLLRTPRLAELLPGTPMGTVQFPDGAAVSEAFGAPVYAPRPFDVNRLAGFRGRALYRAGEFPLVIEEQRGRGRVLYLTFDVARYPFDRWSGMKQLWLSSLRLRPVKPASLHPMEAQGESSVVALVRGQATGFPGHATVLVFLGLYLGILATGYRMGPTGKAGRWLVPWLTWASPLIFAPAAYLLFSLLLFPKGATAVVVSVIEAFPSGPYAHLKLDRGMYANRGDRLRFDYEGLEPVFRPALRARRQGQTTNWEFGEGRRGSVQPDDQRKYVLQVLEGQDVMSYDLSASVVESQAGLRVQVRNNSGTALRDAWLVLDAGAYPLGSVLEDADSVRTFNADSNAIQIGSWREILGASAGSSDRDLHAKEVLLERELGELHERQYPGPDEALLVGFSVSPLRLAGASASWQRRELALVLLRLPVTSLPPGPKELGNAPK